MLERPTRLLSENLARAVDRRTFVKRASQTAFAGLIAVAAGHMMPGSAAARRDPGGRPLPIPQVPQCAPPGPYCNLDGNTQDPNGCHGGHCFQHLYQGQVLQCQVWYCCYQAGCWTTPATGGGYWTCCDCECGGGVAHCGCAQHSSSPVPSPDKPGGGTYH